MNRRGFLSLFGVTAAAIAADPELALWTPGAKVISIPRVMGPGIYELYANPEWRIEMFRLLKDKLVFARLADEMYRRDIGFLSGDQWEGAHEPCVFRKAAGASTFVRLRGRRREAGNIEKPISGGLLA